MVCSTYQSSMTSSPHTALFLFTFRVGISGKKDLYEYWKEDITESLIFDMSGSLQKSSSSPERSGDSPVPTFLVVNVASQEVR